MKKYLVLLFLLLIPFLVTYLEVPGLIFQNVSWLHWKRGAHSKMLLTANGMGTRLVLTILSEPSSQSEVIYDGGDAHVILGGVIQESTVIFATASRQSPNVIHILTQEEAKNREIASIPGRSLESGLLPIFLLENDQFGVVYQREGEIRFCIISRRDEANAIQSDQRLFSLDLKLSDEYALTDKQNFLFEYDSSGMRMKIVAKLSSINPTEIEPGLQGREEWYALLSCSVKAAGGCLLERELSPKSFNSSTAMGLLSNDAIVVLKSQEKIAYGCGGFFSHFCTRYGLQKLGIIRNRNEFQTLVRVIERLDFFGGNFNGSEFSWMPVAVSPDKKRIGYAVLGPNSSYEASILDLETRRVTFVNSDAIPLYLD